MHSKRQSSFSFIINTTHLFLYANYEKKIKFQHSSFVNERKKLSFVLYSIQGSHRKKKPLRNVTRGHPFSMYAKFCEKLTFLTPYYVHVRVRIRRLEVLVFRKILRTYLMDNP